jgi:hypothetical protein
MPMVGTEYECETQCNNSPECLGFSWSAAADTNLQTNCWLKRTLDNRDTHQKSYVTYVKPGVSLPNPCPYSDRSNMGDNYQLSCYDINQDGQGNVSATCQRMNGRWQQTSINVCNTPIKIQNCDGNLVGNDGQC